MHTKIQIQKKNPNSQTENDNCMCSIESFESRRLLSHRVVVSKQLTRGDRLGNFVVAQNHQRSDEADDQNRGKNNHS